MFKENKTPELTHAIKLGLITGGVLASLNTLAFSSRVKRIIKNRDGEQCVICGATDHLEAAHIDHSRGSNYNKPSNGRLLCVDHHLEDHINRAGRNGLPENQNSWAIDRLLDRLP